MARHRVAALVLGAVVSLLAAGCLRIPAARIDHLIGYAIDPVPLRDDAAYQGIVARDATIVTPENHMKWQLIHPQPGVYDFAAADEIVAWAQQHDQQVRGHVLVWHSQLPAWVEQGDWTRGELIEVMRDHIHTVVGHFATEFPGVVTQWDVVNEAFEADGSRRSTLFQDVIGDDYIELAFRFAHEADPDATLFYNDFYDNGIVVTDALIRGAPPGVGATATRSDCGDVPKCAATRDLLSGLIAADVPVHGLGFQAHVFGTAPTDYQQLAGWTDELGLEWAITELDVALPAGGDTPAAEAAQAAAFRSIIEDCVDSAACDTTVMWGVSDDHSWLPAITGGLLDHGLLYGADYRVKPAWTEVFDLLRDRADAIGAGEVPVGTATGGR